jgi:hypothetical protein
MKYKITGSQKEDLLSSVARRKDCPLDILERIIPLLTGADAADAIDNPTLSHDTRDKVWSKLAVSKDEDIRAACASVRSLSMAQCKQLANDASSGVRRWLVENASCPVELLEDLSRDEDDFVRMQVAQNPKCPVDVLKLLSSDPCREVRSAVACHVSTPIDVRKELASDSEPAVRLGAATDPVFQLQIARDKDWSTRSLLAGSENLSDGAVQILASDKRLEVLSSLISNGSVKPEIKARLCPIAVKSKNNFARWEVLTCEYCPPEILVEYGTSKNAHDRQFVARNLRLPLELVKLLAVDKAVEVREKIAENPSVQKDVLELLSSDKRKEVRSAVAINRSTPPATLDKLSKDKDEDVRHSIALNPCCDNGILTALAMDPCPNVRWGIIHRIERDMGDRTTLDIGLGLMNDPDESIRDAVFSRSSILSKCELDTIREILIGAGILKH